MKYIILFTIPIILALLILSFLTIQTKENFSNPFPNNPRCIKYINKYKSCPPFIQTTYNVSPKDIAEMNNDSIENVHYCADLCYKQAYDTGL